MGTTHPEEFVHPPAAPTLHGSDQRIQKNLHGTQEQQPLNDIQNERQPEGK